MNEGQLMMPVAVRSQRQIAKIETASTAAAAAARAEVEAAYVMAMHNPRNVETARVNILEACRRPQFAEAAIYRKPVGKKQNEAGVWEQQFIEDLSIRAAEEMLRNFRNVRIDGMTTYEDSEIRKKRISITDLETNISYAREISLTKSVERRGKKLRDGTVEAPPDRTVLGTRLNSWGEQIFIVEATEDELAIKEAALTSKIIRTEGLRLIPSDIKDEAKEQCYRTQADRDAVDPKASMRKLIDAFSSIGVKPDDLVKYLGHSLDAVQPAEITDLRKIYRTISDGEAKWVQFVEKAESPETAPATIPAAAAGVLAAKKPEAKAEPPPAADGDNQPAPAAETAAAMTRAEAINIIKAAPKGQQKRALAKRDLTPDNFEAASDIILAEVAQMLVKGDA